MTSTARSIRTVESFKVALRILAEEADVSISSLVNQELREYLSEPIIVEEFSGLPTAKINVWVEDDLWAAAVERSHMEGTKLSEVVRQRLESLVSG